MKFIVVIFKNASSEFSWNGRLHTVPRVQISTDKTAQFLLRTDERQSWRVAILSRSSRLIRHISPCLITARTGVLVRESASVTVTSARISYRVFQKCLAFFDQNFVKEFLIFSHS